MLIAMPQSGTRLQRCVYGSLSRKGLEVHARDRARWQLRRGKLSELLKHIKQCGLSTQMTDSSSITYFGHANDSQCLRICAIVGTFQLILSIFFDLACRLGPKITRNHSSQPHIDQSSSVSRSPCLCIAEAECQRSPCLCLKKPRLSDLSDNPIDVRSPTQ